MMILILQLVQGADMELKDLYAKIEEADCHHVVQMMLDKMKVLCVDGVSAIMGLLLDIPDELYDELHPYLQKSSVIGQYLRRIHLSYDKLTFSQVTKLHSRYKVFYDAWMNSSRDNEFSIYGKSQDSEFDISDHNESVDISMAKSEFVLMDSQQSVLSTQTRCSDKFPVVVSSLIGAQGKSVTTHLPCHQIFGICGVSRFVYFKTV